VKNGIINCPSCQFKQNYGKTPDLVNANSKEAAAADQGSPELFQGQERLAMRNS
jgi:uncharacterized Zn finger protein (UPF0148 family)